MADTERVGEMFDSAECDGEAASRRLARRRRQGQHPAARCRLRPVDHAGAVRPTAGDVHAHAVPVADGEVELAWRPFGDDAHRDAVEVVVGVEQPCGGARDRDWTDRGTPAG